MKPVKVFFSEIEEKKGGGTEVESRWGFLMKRKRHQDRGRYRHEVSKGDGGK